jgi:cellulose synthase/poly-beta-1,6-N-acetylglucosamine synthase-like glycosyltransferase
MSNAAQQIEAEARNAETILAIIPTYKGELRISKTLETLGKLQTPARVTLEICVVDNYGRDATPLEVRRWADQHPNIATRCVFQPKPGRMNALQMGVDTTEANWLVMVDDDVSVDEKWLLEGLAAVADNNTVAFCGGPIQLDGETQDVPECVRPFLGYFAVYDFGPQTLELVNRQLAGAGILVRRKAWQECVPTRCRLVGRTSGSMVGGDDIEFQRSMQRRGWIGMYVPGMRLVHRVDPRRLKKSAVFSHAFSVGLEKCFHRMAGRPGFAAIYVLPASFLYDSCLALTKLMRRKGKGWLVERRQIAGQIVSPFYFVWHRLANSFAKVDFTLSSNRDLVA